MGHEHGEKLDARDQLIIALEVGIEFAAIMNDAIFSIGQSLQRNRCGPEIPCEKSADSDDSGDLDLSDAIHLLQFLFLGGSVPPPPHNACGADATPDGLACQTYPPC